MESYTIPSSIMAGKQRPSPILVVNDTPKVEHDESHRSTSRVSIRPLPLQRSSNLTRQLQALNLDDALASPRSAAPARSISSSTTTPIASPALGVLSPPATPPNRSPSSLSNGKSWSALSKTCLNELAADLSDAELLGTGAWSNVYRVEASVILSVSAPMSSSDILTPPSTPQKASLTGTSQVFAVKSASRPDAKDVFEEEARVLSYIQTHDSSAHVVPFFELINTGPALVFHCATTTLESWSATFAPLTSLPALLEVYPFVAHQLTSGLAFLHSIGIIHADIKPSNILLDFPSPDQAPLVRYADFSASILCPHEPSSPSYNQQLAVPFSPIASAPMSRAGSQRKNSALGAGTWTFMAPEQLSSNPLLNEPSYKSDVYALGITMLTILLGGANPYGDLVDQNIFLLREGIKMGNPLSFCKDGSLRSRVLAVEKSEVGKKAFQGIKMGVVKNIAARSSAEDWEVWMRGCLL